MTRHWAWLLVSLGLIVYSLARLIDTVLAEEWDVWVLVFGPACAFLWARVADQHFDALLAHAAEIRKARQEDSDDDPTD